MKIKISNMRLGLANNSSSSHSIVFLDGDTAQLEDWDGGDGGYFARDFFTLTKTDSKMKYLAACLYHSIGELYGSWQIAHLFIKDLFGIDFKTEDYETGELKICEFGEGKYQVDHQSQIAFPCKHGTKYQIHMEFIQDLKDFLSRENVAILGGDDEQDFVHHLSEAKQFSSLKKEISSKKLIARKDGEYWVLFNTENGAKTRFSFNENAAPYTKASWPELVDFKITDFCPFNCPFCYQGSTKEGLHAEKSYLGEITYALHLMEVFEVAIGGGEPTLHPLFVDILRDFRHYGIVPNFTTKNIKWFKDKTIVKAVENYAGAFAYSISSKKEYDSFKKALKESELKVAKEGHSDSGVKVSLQIIMGTLELSELEDLFNHIFKEYDGFSITLLGYKTNGRGSEYAPKDYKGWGVVWKNILKKQKYKRISIDTLLAEQSVEELKGVPEESYHISEGKFSAYIDGVSQKMAPSSYCDSTDFVPLTSKEIRNNKYLEIFSKF